MPFFLSNGKSVRKACYEVVEEVMEVWSRALIPTIQLIHAVNKLEQYNDEWKHTKKNKSLQSEKQQDSQFNFSVEISRLFDIAPQDALSRVRIEEDRTCLEGQRNCRLMFIDSKDKDFERKQKKIL